jgi:hypothetical protein
MFSMYHLYLAAGNSTTIEGWEKDKVATLVRRGKIHDIKYPYVSVFPAPLVSSLSCRTTSDFECWMLMGAVVAEVEFGNLEEYEIGVGTESDIVVMASGDGGGWIGISGES